MCLVEDLLAGKFYLIGEKQRLRHHSVAFLGFLSTPPISSCDAVGSFSTSLLRIGSRLHPDVISEYDSSYVAESGSRPPSTPTTLRHSHMLRKEEVVLLLRHRCDTALFSTLESVPAFILT
ncbi:hypothetical protein BT96DRAFT_459666 [Gymnopus androsaceus JB14]|uniref:Uncharacterized protein n=1 Tax=Gymnopus androsaceus JB14 TaxID=1447944 RepID=A0A6A4IN86_9AGAR|nr:hypothetical protein BT96DRAFT_929568 [Gymnopus androsaceus JB14]KAE9409864.1 hypothetical protein BT96DRAFT_459666 [Gymnopus androsaceus JB14]